MKLLTATQDLLAQLQVVSRVASTRTATPALSGVQIVADEQGVQLRATDNDLGLRVPLDAEVQRPGSVLLPARLLLDIVRQSGAPRLSLELRTEERDVELVAGPAVFHLRALRTEEFPLLPEAGEDGLVEVPADAFVHTIGKVARSASREDTRPLLACVLVRAEGDQLTMVATDSYRLSEKQTTLNPAIADGQGFEANVPARAMQELERLVPATGAASIRIDVRSNQVLFLFGGVVLSSRVVDGTFPQYRSRIPERFDHELRIPTAELREVVRRVALMAQRNAALRLRFAEGELTVSAQTQDVGEAREPLPVAFDGEELEIGFNPEYLRDGLDTIDSDEVLLRLNSPILPGVLEAADDSRFLYLVMPIRLGG